MNNYNLGLEEKDLLDLRELIEWGESTYSQPFFSIERLHGGLTNKTFRLELKGDQLLILRLGGRSTTKYLDRQVEYENSSWAAGKNFGPQILYFEPSTGNSIVEFLQGVTLGEDSFSGNKALLEKGAKSAAWLHKDGPAFNNRVDPFENIRFYGKIAKDTGYAKELVGWGTVARALETLEPVYNMHLDLVACHNDLLPQNYIWDEKKLWIIDWEHSGNNDRYFDLGGFSLENSLTPEQEIEFLTAYWGAVPTLYQQARLQVSKVLVGALWGAWAVMLVGLGKDEDFYFNYGQGRLEESKRQLANPLYKEWLQVLSQGETGKK